MSRLIEEAAVKALVQGKIDLLNERISDGQFAGEALVEAKAKMSALKAVIFGLRFIPDADSSDPARPFPIADAQEA